MHEHLVADTFIGVLSQGMAQLVTHNGCELIVRMATITDEVQKSCIDDDLSARHTEGINLLAVDYIEFPAQSREHRFVAILLEIDVSSSSQTTAHLSDLVVVRAIVAELRLADELAILRRTGGEDLTIGDEVELATARDGYCTAAVEDKETDTEEGSQGHAKLLHIHNSWSRN